MNTGYNPAGEKTNILSTPTQEFGQGKHVRTPLHLVITPEYGRANQSKRPFSYASARAMTSGDPLALSHSNTMVGLSVSGCGYFL